MTANIIYPNLRAEMARAGITMNAMATTLGMNRDTLHRKLSGKTPIYLKDAVAIRDTFFQGAIIDSLFSEAEQ